MAAIVIEGVIGVAKTSVAAALLGRSDSRLIGEIVTFDEHLIASFVDSARALNAGLRRLAGVLDTVEQSFAVEPWRDVVLERFHLSYVAVDGEWAPYRVIDERAAALGLRLVLLDLPDAEFADRCLYRREFDGADWQQMVAFYGSERAALSALRESQARRRGALDVTTLPHMTINTSAKDWSRYADTILAWAHE